QGHLAPLQLHVFAVHGATLPHVHLHPRLARRRREPPEPAGQPRGGRQVAAAAHPDLRPQPRLAQPAFPLLQRQSLQPLLSRRGRGRPPDAHDDVFVKKDGKVRHFWASELLFTKADKGQNQRHVDMIWPLWNVLDLTPEGRGQNWYPKITY